MSIVIYCGEIGQMEMQLTIRECRSIAKAIALCELLVYFANYELTRLDT